MRARHCLQSSRCSLLRFSGSEWCVFQVWTDSGWRFNDGNGLNGLNWIRKLGTQNRDLFERSEKSLDFGLYHHQRFVTACNGACSGTCVHRWNQNSMENAIDLSYWPRNNVLKIMCIPCIHHTPQPCIPVSPTLRPLPQPCRLFRLQLLQL